MTKISQKLVIRFARWAAANMAGEFSESEIRALFTVGDDFEWTP